MHLRFHWFVAFVLTTLSLGFVDGRLHGIKKELLRGGGTTSENQGWREVYVIPDEMDGTYDMGPDEDEVEKANEEESNRMEDMAEEAEAAGLAAEEAAAKAEEEAAAAEEEAKIAKQAAMDAEAAAAAAFGALQGKGKPVPVPPPDGTITPTEDPALAGFDGKEEIPVLDPADGTITPPEDPSYENAVYDPDDMEQAAMAEEAAAAAEEEAAYREEQMEEEGMEAFYEAQQEAAQETEEGDPQGLEKPEEPVAGGLAGLIGGGVGSASLKESRPTQAAFSGRTTEKPSATDAVVDSGSLTSYGTKDELPVIEEVTSTPKPTTTSSAGLHAEIVVKDEFKDELPALNGFIADDAGPSFTTTSTTFTTTTTTTTSTSDESIQAPP